MPLFPVVWWVHWKCSSLVRENHVIVRGLRKFSRALFSYLVCFVILSVCSHNNIDICAWNEVSTLLKLLFQLMIWFAHLHSCICSPIIVLHAFNLSDMKRYFSYEIIQLVKDKRWLFKLELESIFHFMTCNSHYIAIYSSMPLVS